MNSKDIESARRIIAQFEGRALGRHNSGADLRRNAVAGVGNLTAAILETFGIGKLRWSECAIGDYCARLPGGADPRTDQRWKVSMLDESPIVTFMRGDYNSYAEQRAVEIREFESARVINAGGREIIYLWRRIA